MYLMSNIVVVSIYLVYVFLLVVFISCFLNYSASTEISTSLHTLSRRDALPICSRANRSRMAFHPSANTPAATMALRPHLFAHQPAASAFARAQKLDRKSTRLNSSH